MATNRNFIVKQGIQVGANATIGNTFTSNTYQSNKADVTSRPVLALDFTKGKLDSRVLCSRSSNATAVSANGTMTLYSSNTARIEYDPTQIGRSMGLVCEEQLTNIYVYSDIEGSVGTAPTGMGWATSGVSYDDQTPVVSTDFWIGPNKKSAKHTRGGGSDNNVGYMGGAYNFANNIVYTGSTYLYIPSSSNVTYLQLGFDAYNTTTVPAGGASYVSANLSIRDAWQRVTTTVFVTSTLAGNFTAPVLRMEPKGAIVYSDCWQLEQNYYASTYIPTLGSQATRADEVHYLYPIRQFFDSGVTTDMYYKSNTNVSAAFSVLVEATPKWTGNTQIAGFVLENNQVVGNRGLFGIVSYSGPANPYNGLPYNGYGIYPYPTYGNGQMQHAVRNFASNQIAGSATSGSYYGTSIFNSGYQYPSNSIVANTTFKVATMYSSNSSVICMNGDPTTITNNSGTGPLPCNSPMDQITLGWQITGGAGPFQLGGNLRKVAMWSKALSNTELIALSET